MPQSGQTTELTEVVNLFHQGADSLTQYFAELGRSDNDMLMAFDEIDKFLSTAEPVSQDVSQRELFNARANELILLIDRLMFFSSQIQHLESLSYFEKFLFSFGLWFARSGGIISKLVPIVNLVVSRANRLREQSEIKQLHKDINTIIQVTSQSVKFDMDDRDPHRPWRILVLNYAITATRTHDPALMEQSFEFLIHHLPDDLKQFFTEGMSQMTELDYPESVKEVMEKYYWQYAAHDIKNN